VSGRAKGGAGGARKRGPKPIRIRVEGAWEEALGRAVRKPRPASGWPKPQKRKKPPQ